MTQAARQKPVSAVQGGGIDAWLRHALPGDEPFRQAAVEHVRLSGLPTVKSERWKYSDLPRALRDMSLVPASVAGWADTDHQAFAPPSPAIEAYGDSALWHLNTAYGGSIRVIDVPAGQIVETPFIVNMDGDEGQWLSPRLIVRLGAGARARLIERHGGRGTYWKNGVSIIDLKEGACLSHTRIQADSLDSMHTQFTFVECGKDARYDSVAYNIGAGFSRHQAHVDMAGAAAACTLSHVALLAGEQHGDTTITVDHRAPNCRSNQDGRTVLSGRARGVFQGKVHVYKEGQKTDGYQLSRALSLSPLAIMDTKPELEIYADDVKCSHGATTGQVDDDALFYMMSRGIPKAEARALLIQAFVAGILEKIEDEDIRSSLITKTQEWLDENSS